MNYSRPFRKNKGTLTKLRKNVSDRKRYFCSEFVVQCFIECGYIDENQDYFNPKYWSPTGLAEENIFTLVGFMSNGGLAAVHPGDPHIGGCGWVLRGTSLDQKTES